MSIGNLAELFLTKPDTDKATKETFVPSMSPLHTPNEQRERRNKFAKINQRKA